MIRSEVQCLNADINGRRYEDVAEKAGAALDKLFGDRTRFGELGKKIDDNTKDFTFGFSWGRDR